MNSTVDLSTGALLLDTLREVTGVGDLRYATPPAPLTGGFYAEMLRFRLADPPPHLDRDLVARIVPSPVAGTWEATVQRAVAEQGFPTPQVRLTAPETSPLGRYLIVMDLVDGRPPMEGLTIATVGSTIPSLMRRLPDQLARIAADLHALPSEPLADQLRALEGGFPTTTAGFVGAQADIARLVDRPDIAAAAERLLASEPRSTAQAITHGDLHPFNVLVTPEGRPALIDWTIARVAHPGFTIGFTDLMLANPPIAVPRGGAPVLRALGRVMSKRFLGSYRDLTAGTEAAVDDAELDWHRKVHALRILVELAGWDAAGTRPTSPHPWFILEPVARRALAIGP